MRRTLTLFRFLHAGHHFLHILFAGLEVPALADEFPGDVYMGHKPAALGTDEQMQAKQQASPPAEIVVNVVAGFVSHVSAIQHSPVS